MLHSTITQKGQTTIPSEIRQLLGLKPGDVLAYAVEGGAVTLRVHAGTRAVKGALASAKGKGMPFGAIRKAAAKASIRKKSP